MWRWHDKLLPGRAPTEAVLVLRENACCLGFARMNVRQGATVKAFMEDRIAYSADNMATVFLGTLDLVLQIERQCLLAASRSARAQTAVVKLVTRPGALLIRQPAQSWLQASKAAGHEGQLFYPPSPQRGRARGETIHHGGIESILPCCGPPGRVKAPPVLHAHFKSRGARSPGGAQTPPRQGPNVPEQGSLCTPGQRRVRIVIADKCVADAKAGIRTLRLGKATRFRT